MPSKASQTKINIKINNRPHLPKTISMQFHCLFHFFNNMHMTQQNQGNKIKHKIHKIKNKTLSQNFQQDH